MIHVHVMLLSFKTNGADYQTCTFTIILPSFYINNFKRNTSVVEPLPLSGLIQQTTNWLCLSYLSQKLGFDISYKFSGKNKKIIRISSAEFFTRHSKQSTCCYQYIISIYRTRVHAFYSACDII